MQFKPSERQRQRRHIVLRLYDETTGRTNYRFSIFKHNDPLPSPVRVFNIFITLRRVRVRGKTIAVRYISTNLASRRYAEDRKKNSRYSTEIES
jgi:hypothetical protein